MRISQQLATSCRRTPERAKWLKRLPDTVATLERRWNLTPGTSFYGEDPSCSYVAAVVTATGTPAVLKVGMPHMEAAHEVAGLRFWAGDPTVHLLTSDDETGAMLLERCRPGTTLRTLQEDEQDVVISGRLRQLWRLPPTPHPFRHLSAVTEYWSKETLAQAKQWPEAGLVREGLRFFKELPRNATKEVLLATDLHAGNVLRAEREPWLVIDPKPFVGDPAYDATQHLFNCWTRLRSDPDETIRRFADLLGVDHQRVRLWTFARAAAEPREDWNNNDQFELARALAP
jgi:streptomycin 6-kinase